MGIEYGDRTEEECCTDGITHREVGIKTGCSGKQDFLGIKNGPLWYKPSAEKLSLYPVFQNFRKSGFIRSLKKTFSFRVHVF